MRGIFPPRWEMLFAEQQTEYKKVWKYKEYAEYCAGNKMNECS